MERLTAGVQTLLGDPKRAVLRLSLPMMAAMFVQSLYNMVDAIWVSGLGSEALAAVGLFFPFMTGMMALATGLGVGGSSAVSRRIGARDKEGAERAALLTLSLGLLASLLFLAGVPLALWIFTRMGARGEAAWEAAVYGQILFGGAAILFFANLATALLRGEGDARRAMYAIILGGVLNVGLDPLFIYTFHLGVAGAAWATLASLFCSALLLSFWLFLRPSTYLHLSPKKLRWDPPIIREILAVGAPASLAQLSMSLAMLAVNGILLRVGGERAVAVFGTGWRVVTLGTIPMNGMATGVTAVTAAAFGARDGGKLRTAYLYAIRLGVLVQVGIASFVALAAPALALLFTYAPGSLGLRADLVAFLRWMCLFLPTVPLGMLTSAMFNGVRMGGRALLLTVLRTVILQAVGGWTLGVALGLGERGVWWGIIAANVLMAWVGFTWGTRTVGVLSQKLSGPVAE
ncbi:MAG: MATE family efflux transporter [Candidatus Bipolaricaulota bacterium]|nr:MATE family efflux transporter [Candidatus Bipolaricaulota bacterium]MDW8126800.1 MATE family efflux transporter [Candidatus Bipolaricaulota bacterium]